ncbi:MAG: DUF1499 domain-containing protein [Burkholderiales bacterium]|nr:MAG: DUF1499 domain-containing protein [Burkholderiales bacterium]
MIGARRPDRLTGRRLALGVLLVLAALPLAACGGLLSGTRPAQRGPVDGRLRPVREDLSNAVSSVATTEYHRIAPIAASPDPAAAFARLRAVVAAMPGAAIVDERPGYLYAEFTTHWLRFVDDVEFLVDEQAAVIHVRSASRLGRRDFGVNRERIEAIRAGMAG